MEFSLLPIKTGLILKTIYYEKKKKLIVKRFVNISSHPDSEYTDSNSLGKKVKELPS